MATQPSRQPVSQPAPGSTDDLYIGRLKADFFIQLPEERIFRIFARLNATLRKLPRIVATDPPRP